MADKTENLYTRNSKTEKLNNCDATERLNESVTSNHQNAGGKSRCMGCMELINENEELCSYCGYVKNTGVEQPLHILPGTMLKNKYMLGKVLGYGGFGVTYIGWDITLQRKIAVKEYLPSEFSTRAYGQTKVTVFSGDRAQQFEDGKRKFIDEAKRLAKFQGESGIVNIFDSFEENGTAYIVMEYLDGVTLKEYLSKNGKIPAQKAVELLVPVLESLNKIHAAGIIHRDVSPDNIMITKDGRVKLIDFGAARYATTTASRSLTVIIKPGYSPEEQYRSRSDQGPYTDVYSLGAVLYKMITGETPPDALKRRAFYESKGKEILVPVHKLVKGVPKNIEYAIYNAMNPRIEDRTPDMVNFMGELFSDEPIKRKNGKIKKVDVLTWPLWAKILAPSLISIALILSILLGVGVIGPRSKLQLGVQIPEGKTLIPDVVTETLDKAKKKLKKSDLELLIGEKVEDERIKENLILAQSPEAGEVIKKGTIIEVKISAGAPKEFVIDVNGFTKELAKKELEALGFKVEFKEEFNEDFAPGAVISQSVKAGEQLSKGGTIKLVISKGNKDIDTSKSAKIPEVIGMDIEKAKELAKKTKLYIVIEKTEYSPKIPKNQIISQTPEKGFDGHQGDTIKVTVSLGIKTSYMPDVVYRTQEKAIEMLESLGLKVKVVEEENKEVAAGTVFKQSIKKGEEVKAGTTVTITVSKGASAKVPNTVGKTEAEGRKLLENAGFKVTVKKQNSDSVAKGIIISQSVKGSSSANKGSNITITVSLGKKGPEPVKVIDSGRFPDLDYATIYYKFESDGTFTVSGTGDMYPSTDKDAHVPWESYRHKIKKLIVKKGVSTIGGGNFEKCTNLTSVVIEDGLKYIEYYAFEDCDSLRSINIPASVEGIDGTAFVNCNNFTKINIDERNKYLCDINGVVFSKDKKTIFAYPSGLKGTYNIPNGVEVINHEAFKLCNNLTGVTIPSSVKTIGYGAFSGCKNISKLTIPKSVTTMEWGVFSRWTANQTLYIVGRSSAPSTWRDDWNDWCEAKIVWNA